MERDQHDPQRSKRGYNDLHDVRTQMRGQLTGGCRKKISREGLFLCHAQFNGSRPRKRIMGETSIKGFYSRAIMDKARVVRAGLVWWSQRDLNPCFNHAHVFGMFSDMLNELEL